MDVQLILGRCGPKAALGGEVAGLSDDAQQALLDPTPGVAVSAAVVQVDGRLAVGRREGPRAVWWVIPAGFTLQPPHAMWQEPGLFRPDDDGAVPTGVDARALVARLDGEVAASGWLAQLVGLVRRLRDGSGPLAVVSDASQQALEALAILAAGALGADLTVSVGHPSPDPQRFRLSLGPAVEGFERLADPPPGPGADVIARFVRSRAARAPQQLFRVGGLDEDHVRLVMEEEVPTAPSAPTLAHALQRGVRIDDDRVRQLLEQTFATGDATPWQQVALRPEAERRRAFGALVKCAESFVPTHDLLRVLLRGYPRGAPLLPLCRALLAWMRRDERPSRWVDALTLTLADWPQDVGRTSRAELWSEAVGLLVDAGEGDAACQAVCGPVALRMIGDGEGQRIAALWADLPTEQRDASRLVPLLQALGGQLGGDRPAATLLRHVDGSSLRPALDAWHAGRGERALSGDDAVLRMLRTEAARFDAWVAAAIDAHGPGAVERALLDPPPALTDEVWAVLFARLAAERMPPEAVALGLELPRLEPLEPTLRGLLPDALVELRFPNARVATAAATLAELPGDALWAWIGVAAAEPGALDDAVIDGTVVAVCANPAVGAARQACLRGARQLGAAASWEPLDHARWIVRLALAPQVEGFAEALLEALLEGLTGRFDAAPHVAAVVCEMAQLPPDHPALEGLLTRWLPQVWHARVPLAFLEAVEARGVPDAARPLWEAFVHADG